MRKKKMEGKKKKEEACTDDFIFEEFFTGRGVYQVGEGGKIKRK